MQQHPRRAVASAGDDAIEFAESIGYELDEWQQFCIRGILSEDEHARLCAETSLLIVPRQNGKGAVLEVVELYALFVMGLPTILHSAHLGETSADHMARLWAAIGADADLGRRVKPVLAKGYEAIERTDGVMSEIRFRTRSKKGGRGGSPQMVVFDEALFLTDAQVSAMLPSLSAQTMGPDAPLLIYASSAPIGESEVLHNLRNSVLLGEAPDAWMAEWSVEPPAGDRMAGLRALTGDLDAWMQANPGGGVRISPTWSMGTERAGMSLEAWCIERLGVVFATDGESGVLPSAKWEACTDLSSHAVDGRIGMAVGPNGSWAALGFAGVREDGLLHVEIVRHEMGVRHAMGTDWLLEAAQAGTARYGPLIVDPRSPSAGAIEHLRAHGVPLEELSTGDVVKASTGFQDDVANVRLRHLGQGELTAAVIGADIRPVGESWVFSAKASSVDVTPLLAVVLAASGARKPAAVETVPGYYGIDDEEV